LLFAHVRLKRMCNNNPRTQMKRLFPTSLALLLAMSSLGHVFAAAFCPRVLGGGCCFAKAPDLKHLSPTCHEDMAMPMGEAAMDGMGTDDRSMHDMPATSSSSFTDDDALTSKFEQPFETCTHCLSHSGILNAPLSSVSAADQSNKDFGSGLCPVCRFLVPSATTVSRRGLPREHAPPGSSAPRYILISVFLI